mmetsp:Transcript_105221/g.280107  ORF Transcript_105221/g.280107 Transcript_105221/m.280107 type:complete len:176 (-) Transcript_105221:69-596(-)
MATGASAAPCGAAPRRTPSVGQLLAVLAVATSLDTAAASGVAMRAAAVDTKAVLETSKNATTKLRHSVTQMMTRSTEEMKSLKSLLTTNAKGTRALNDMLLEMSRLTTRMGRFTGSMERCKQQIAELQARDAEVQSSQEGYDPLLGTTALLQLHEHVQTLRAHMSEAKRKLLAHQ